MTEPMPGINRFELLVFDWDGTLSDSLGYIVTAMQSAITAVNLESRDEEVIKNIIGLGLEDAIFTLYPGLKDHQCRALINAYRMNYLELTSVSPALYPGVEATIKNLHSRGYLLAVATGKSRSGLKRALEDSGLGTYFHASRCADETHSKPHPQMLIEIMEHFNIERCATLMIGDSVHDMQMAKNAEVNSIAVNYGALDKRRLLEFDPIMCLDNIRELDSWLGGIDVP